MGDFLPRRRLYEVPSRLGSFSVWDSEQEFPGDEVSGGVRTKGDSGAKAEDVVPVFARRAHAVDRGMEGHHGPGHGFSGVIEVEAAMEDAGLGHQVG